MEICDFAYHQPATLAEASALGLRFGPDARYLAGGTELLPDLKQHRDRTQHLIDLSRLPQLQGIRLEEKSLRIGSLTTLNAVAESCLVRETLPALSEAILTMAAVQVRNRGTLGGNFCSGVPSADTPPIAIASGAEVLLCGTQGERVLPAEAFFQGPRRVDLRSGEILIEVRIPVPGPGFGASYERFALRRATALAVVGVAVSLSIAGDKIERARVVLGAVAPVPMLASGCASRLIGRKPEDALFEEVAAVAAEEARPISDLRGSAPFRREIVEVLTRRALSQARARAGAGS